MSTTITNIGSKAVAAEGSRPAYDAYRILHLGFTAAPILAGVDKFFHLLCNWDQYLAPWIASLSPIGGHGLMLAVGVIEVAAGVLTAVKPRWGAPVVAAWLVAIILDLVSMGSYLDVALRDFGLALAAFALWRLATEFSPSRDR
jgi:hypothetical protein